MKMMRCLVLILSLSLSLAFGPAWAADDDEVNYLDLAALMLRDGNLDRAVTALDQVDLTEEELDLVRYYTLRGMVHLRRQEPELAAEALESAIESGEVESIVWVYLAQTYFQLERYEDVLSALDRAGPELDRVAAVWNMRAQVHWLLEQPDMALATLDAASAVFPGDTSFLRRKVFFLIELGLFREAIEQGSIFLEAGDVDVNDYVALGNALRASGQSDQAALFLEKARLKYPVDENVAKVLARTYIDREQLTPAAELIYEASLLNPELRAEAVELYRRAGQVERAMLLNGQVADQSVKLKQRLALQLETGQFEQAATMETALRRNGLLQDEDVRYALAYAHFKTGRFDTAEDHLQALTQPELFRKAAELRRAIQECEGDAWKCY